MRVSLPAGLAFLHKVIDPVDQSLKDALPEEGAIAVFGGQGHIEAESTGARLAGHADSMTDAAGDACDCGHPCSTPRK
jgi:hypothetical protein